MNHNQTHKNIKIFKQIDEKIITYCVFDVQCSMFEKKCDTKLLWEMHSRCRDDDYWGVGLKKVIICCWHMYKIVIRVTLY